MKDCVGVWANLQVNAYVMEIANVLPRWGSLKIRCDEVLVGPMAILKQQKFTAPLTLNQAFVGLWHSQFRCIYICGFTM